MMKRDEIIRRISQRPNDMLDLGRTILANERTLLAFLRTGLGLLAGGIGIVGFVNRPGIVIMGWLAIVFSIPIIIWGGLEIPVHQENLDRNCRSRSSGDGLAKLNSRT